VDGGGLISAVLLITVISRAAKPRTAGRKKRFIRWPPQEFREAINFGLDRRLGGDINSLLAGENPISRKNRFRKTKVMF
jgi:hypothetical protein